MEIQPSENGNTSKLLLPLLLVLFVFSAGLLFWTLKEKMGPEEEDFPEEVGGNVVKKEEDLIPKNTKSPEDFLAKIETKAEEIQKKYDSNLTDFSRRKWMNISKALNGLDENFFNDGFVILNQETVKETDQSVLFKIKYRAKTAGGEVENEDFFYLILSGEKVKNLNLTEITANAFLTEDEIKNNIAKEGFAKINKIGQ